MKKYLPCPCCGQWVWYRLDLLERRWTQCCIFFHCGKTSSPGLCDGRGCKGLVSQASPLLPQHWMYCITGRVPVMQYIRCCGAGDAIHSVLWQQGLACETSKGLLCGRGGTEQERPPDSQLSHSAWNCYRLGWHGKSTALSYKRDMSIIEVCCIGAARPTLSVRSPLRGVCGLAVPD